MNTVLALERVAGHVIPITEDSGLVYINLASDVQEILRQKGDAAKTILKSIKLIQLKYPGIKNKSVTLGAIDRLVAEYSSSVVIETTTELNLKQGWSVVDIEIPDVAKQHIVVVRPSAKSDVSYIYVTEDVSATEDLADAYKYVKSAVERQEWCNESTDLLAKGVVISTIQQQKEIASSKPKELQSLSKNRANGRDLIVSAIDRGTSDIHIYYYQEKTSEVQFRVDKRLTYFNSYRSSDVLSMLRTIYMDGTNVSGIGFVETVPQEMDIQFTTMIGGSEKSFTLRWQSIPQDGGLKVVIRILNNDPQAIKDLTFDGMGYSDLHLAMIMSAISNKKGFILTTGTTGSGKSTTNIRILYEMKRANPHWSFCTVEDPIEYRMDGLVQIPVQESYVEGTSGFDEGTRRKMAFNKILSGLMRQDPDVIGVGEIRDETTATIVEDFVNTGHKMIATLHADSALYVFDRLKSIGIGKDTMCRPGFFSLIVYQSLQTRVCRFCSTTLEKSTMNKVQGAALSTLFGGKTENVRVHNPEGCDHCNNGLKGMTVCAEILKPDNKLLQHIRDDNYVGAEHYWLNEMPTIDPTCVFQGKTMTDHMLFKIMNGELCPIICMEEGPDYATLLLSDRDYSFLRGPIMKGVSNG